MKLPFVKTQDVWVSEFTAPAPYNLHIELSKLSAWLTVYHRGSDDQVWCKKQSMHFINAMDCDFTDGVYPKQVRLVLTEDPKVAELTLGTTAGGGSVDENALNALKASIAEQAAINAQQQEQIDRNTEVNVSQETVLEGAATEEAKQEDIDAMFL